MNPLSLRHTNFSQTGLRKFLLRLTLFGLVLLGMLAAAAGISILGSPGKFGPGVIPGNYVSNSSCFNAKLDHLVHSDHLAHCSFLIAGSSMSLCNISGKRIEASTGETVYNVSAWGIKPAQTTQLLKIIDKKNINTLLLAFNNSDFGELTNNVDFSATELFIKKGPLRRLYLLFKQMSYKNFLFELGYRMHFSKITNHYESLNFDETGSVQLEPEGFVIDEKKWKRYFDTTGFSTFQAEIAKLDLLCKTQGIHLIPVYLPARADLMDGEKNERNAFIAEKVRAHFQMYFIDLHEAKLPSEMYCDGIHFFKEGSEIITRMVVDTLEARRLISPVLTNIAE